MLHLQCADTAVVCRWRSRTKRNSKAKRVENDVTRGSRDGFDRELLYNIVADDIPVEVTVAVLYYQILYTYNYIHCCLVGKNRYCTRCIYIMYVCALLQRVLYINHFNHNNI